MYQSPPPLQLNRSGQLPKRGCLTGIVASLKSLVLFGLCVALIGLFFNHTLIEDSLLTVIANFFQTLLAIMVVGGIPTTVCGTVTGFLIGSQLKNTAINRSRYLSTALVTGSIMVVCITGIWMPIMGNLNVQHILISAAIIGSLGVFHLLSCAMIGSALHTWAIKKSLSDNSIEPFLDTESTS